MGLSQGIYLYDCGVGSKGRCRKGKEIEVEVDNRKDRAWGIKVAYLLVWYTSLIIFNVYYNIYTQEQLIHLNLDGTALKTS